MLYFTIFLINKGDFDMKLTHSIVAIATLSTLSFAGGDINPVTVFEQEPIVVPVEPVPVVKAPAVEAPVLPVPASKFYFGLGATKMKVKQDANAALGLVDASDSQTGITARLGYDFMDYLGAELRGASAISGVDTANNAEKIKQIGAYLKPNFDLTDSLNLYGLLGASKVNMSEPGTPNTKTTGFSYGLGLDYAVSDTFSVFIDAVDYLRKSNKNDVYGATLGAAYHF